MEPAGRSAEDIRRRLRIVRWVALLDLILLVALVASSLSGNREFVRVLGPLHGGNFLLLLVIVATAAADGFWGWWFPAAILVSTGPPGALAGEWIIGRRLAASGVGAGNEAPAAALAPATGERTGGLTAPGTGAAGSPANGLEEG